MGVTGNFTHMDKLEKLSDRICFIRKNRRMSQEQLSELLNVSRSAIGQWEIGKSSPTVEKLCALAVKTGASSEWLLTGRGPFEFKVWLEGIAEMNASPYAVSLGEPEKQLIKAMDSVPLVQRQKLADALCRMIELVAHESGLSE